MATRTQQRQNGTDEKAQAEAQALVAAIEHEEAIRVEAEEIRGEAQTLTPALFLKLRPLLRRPIPRAFIQRVGPVSGKMYDSTGIKSVQVQMDRLDNVLSTQWWGYTREFSDNGKLCEVHAWIGSDPATPLVKRDSFGGVQNGQPGNLYKGSFTNAAKPAFARLGPGWEVYVGAADYDPDTNEEAAAAQADGGTRPAVNPAEGPELEIRARVLSHAKEAIAADLWTPQQLSVQMVAAGATDTSSAGAAVASMSIDQAEAFDAQMVAMLEAAKPADDQGAETGAKS